MLRSKLDLGARRDPLRTMSLKLIVAPIHGSQAGCISDLLAEGSEDSAVLAKVVVAIRSQLKPLYRAVSGFESSAEGFAVDYILWCVERTLAAQPSLHRWTTPQVEPAQPEGSGFSPRASSHLCSRGAAAKGTLSASF